MNALKTVNLKKYYSNGGFTVKALDGVDIDVKEEEFVSIMGTSGSGKSTLLNMLGGLDNPTSGDVYVSNNNIVTLKPEEVIVFRRKNIGFIFQNYNLLPMISVKDNITLPVHLDGKEVDEDYLCKIVKKVGLNNKLNNKPKELSGGQQQRVAIARALIVKPKIILADEPTGNLDTGTSSEVMDLLVSTSKEFKQTIALITHNEHIANMADRVIHIEDGKIVK